MKENSNNSYTSRTILVRGVFKLRPFSDWLIYRKPGLAETRSIILETLLREKFSKIKLENGFFTMDHSIKGKSHFVFIKIRVIHAFLNSVKGIC